MTGREAMGIHIMKNYGTKSARLQSKGFTLIASLLMLLLLSGIAIGLLMMVNTEGKVGGTDLQNNLAFHAAEGGIEKMSSDLSAVFQSAQSPTAAQICSVGSAANQPVMVGVTWQDYSVMPGTTTGTVCPTTLTANWGQISNGPNEGLWAQIIPVNMLATAALPGGQEVSMTRGAQVALIPVFQFGVFCEGDCGFFDSPNLTFAGRVHTNADLYLGVASGDTLTFNNKLEAYGNVVTEVLPNNLSASTYSDTGNVYIPTTVGGCTTPTTNCVTKAVNGGSQFGDGSVQGAGGSPAQSAYNTSYWNTFSKTTTNQMIINGNYGSTSTPGTGAKKLSMPFVAAGVLPNELIRRPESSDTPALTESREYNLAQIHVLLSDNPAELPGGAADVNNVRLANITATQATATGGTATNPYGIALASGNYPSLMGVPTAGSFSLYFASASNGYLPDTTSCAGAACPVTTCSSSTCSPQYLQADWPLAPQTAQSGAQTLVPIGPPAAPVLSAGATPYPTFALCSGTVGGTLPAGCSATTPVSPYLVVGNTANTQTWNLIDGYLRVEYEDSSGNWHPVTNEWLSLGFARGMTAPTQSGGGTPVGGSPNPINPNAILLLQEPADRNGSGGLPDSVGIAPRCTATNHSTGACTTWSNPLPPEVLTDAAVGNATYGPYFGVTHSGAPVSSSTLTSTGQSVSVNNWYPINFYDTREGEARDTDWGNNSCTTTGLMNAVEIDVGNLKRWLAGSIGTSGPSVGYIAQNGYVLYFSDRRGMLTSPVKGYKVGESGLEDVINSSSVTGVPDGVLEPVPAGHSLSPEDVNQNGVLDSYGTANLGLGQWSGTFNQSTGQLTSTVNQDVQIIAATPDNPYSPRMASCSTTARKNWVSGARHVLRLVDGSFGNVPVSPVGTLTDPGGFTVAAENPVYIQGDYNSNAADPFWTGGADIAGHSSAAVIGDAVSVLSNNWNDEISMVGVSGNSDVTYAQGPYAGNRIASTTYYRLAIAGGKNLAFPFPSWESSTDYGFGTDGGVHNFLRFLEDWTGQTLNYGGSLVSLYYATYDTGIFKCCTYSVYSPPVRNYIFDSDFTLPQGLPPGTPMFRDVEALSYRQMFTARTY
jgi:Tfp pilus assembly protein PilX